MTSSTSLAYAAVSVTTRPARVVVVINGGAHWSYWARRALYRAGRVWGGAGFAVVPHQNGVVHPVLLRACQAYDPDYVVAYHPTVADIEHFQPGWFQNSLDGQNISGEERDRLFEMARADMIPVDADDLARNQVSAVCSPYQSGEHVGRHEAIEYLGDEDSRHFPSVFDLPSTWLGSVLACPAEWGGVWGAAVASHAGVAAAPVPGAGEPDITDQVRNHLTAWMLDMPGGVPADDLVWHPTAAVGVDTTDTPTAHDRTRTHLTTITTNYGYGHAGLLVLGDSAEDFALARLWSLTFGFGWWLPPALGMGEEDLPWPISMGVPRIVSKLVNQGGTLAITSLSVQTAELEQSCDRLRESSTRMEHTAKAGEAIEIISGLALPWNQPATVGLAVQDQWDTVVPIPVTTDSTSTVAMATPLPAPTLVHPELAQVSDSIWHVDVQWRPSQAVCRRGLDSRELFADRPAMMQTWARSSRHGTTYQSQRYDLVVAGTRSENRLARVALRDLSLQAWMSAKGAEHGLGTRPSDAGRRATLLARMLGGRKPYTELFGGPLLPALLAMRPTSATTKEAYLDGGGVALSSSDGVLSFAGLCNRAPALSPGEVRERVDAVARAGVIRRGMVLQCATCEHKQFRAVDQLRQRWPCQRCDAGNDLDRWAWKAPADEPIWFYDLHPVGRQVLQDNGHVPALLSVYLRSQITKPDDQFDDVTETEFTFDGSSQAELDLVVYTDDTLTIAECKKTGTALVGKSGRMEITKKCRAASWLRADRIVFATTAEEWTSNSRSAVQRVVEGCRDWGPLGAPQIALITGLGTGHTITEIL